MKTLAPIIIGEHSVTVTIEDHGHDAILFTATCGGTKLQGAMTCAWKHDHSAEQVQKDVSDFAHRLAEEAAGKEQTAKLKANLFGV